MRKGSRGEKSRNGGTDSHHWQRHANQEGFCRDPSVHELSLLGSVRCEGLRPTTQEWSWKVKEESGWLMGPISSEPLTHVHLMWAAEDRPWASALWCHSWCPNEAFLGGRAGGQSTAQQTQSHSEVKGMGLQFRPAEGQPLLLPPVPSGLKGPLYLHMFWNWLLYFGIYVQFILKCEFISSPLILL